MTREDVGAWLLWAVIFIALCVFVTWAGWSGWVDGEANLVR